jgi:quercetin dioxygenase-like cupin family protein
MAIPHAQAGEPIDIRPFGPALPDQQTATLFRAQSLEVIRLVVPAGKEIPAHSAPDEMTVQCLEGRVAFTTMGKTLELTPGTMLFLKSGEPHALRGIENSSLLLTLIAPRPA